MYQQQAAIEDHCHIIGKSKLFIFISVSCATATCKSSSCFFVDFFNSYNTFNIDECSEIYNYCNNFLIEIKIYVM